MNLPFPHEEPWALALFRSYVYDQGLFRVGSSEGSGTAGVVNSTDGRSPASPTEQGDKLGIQSDVGVVASPE